MRYLEDLPVGESITLGEVTIDEGEMVAFAQRFDPQAFHVDAEAASATSFGGLIASGWFTGSLFSRLSVDGFLGDVANLGGLGVEELRFPHPVRAGDVLRAQLVVTEARPSERRLDRGTVTLAGSLTNQHDTVVLTLTIALRVSRRPAQ